MSTLSVTLLIMSNSCSPHIRSIASSKVYKTSEMGFAQANMYNGLLFTSGQVGWDTDYQLIGSGSFEEQINQTMTNLGEILREAGSTYDDVIMLRIYVKDLDRQKRMQVGTMLGKFYPGSHKPASSLIGVAMLAREDLLVEIEIIAKSKNQKP